MKLEQVLLQGIRADQPVATDVAEGSLYYVTDETVLEQSLGGVWTEYSNPGAGGGITSLTTDVTATGPGVAVATIQANAVTSGKIINDAVTTSKILNSNVTYAKIQNVADARLLGNFSGAPAAPSEYSLGSGLEHSAGAIRTTVAVRTQQIGITVDGGGSVLTTGIKGYKSFPVAGTITGWRILADIAGDVDFDVTQDPFASYPPTTSILTPSLSGVDSDEATGLSIAVAAGDVFGFEITGTPATITRVTLEITIVVT